MTDSSVKYGSVIACLRSELQDLATENTLLQAKIKFREMNGDLKLTATIAMIISWFYKRGLLTDDTIDDFVDSLRGMELFDDLSDFVNLITDTDGDANSTAARPRPPSDSSNVPTPLSFDAFGRKLSDKPRRRHTLSSTLNELMDMRKNQNSDKWRSQYQNLVTTGDELKKSHESLDKRLEKVEELVDQQIMKSSRWRSRLKGDANDFKRGFMEWQNSLQLGLAVTSTPIKSAKERDREISKGKYVESFNRDNLARIKDEHGRASGPSSRTRDDDIDRRTDTIASTDIGVKAAEVCRDRGNGNGHRESACDEQGNTTCCSDLQDQMTSVRRKVAALTSIAKETKEGGKSSRNGDYNVRLREDKSGSVISEDAKKPNDDGGFGVSMTQSPKNNARFDEISSERKRNGKHGLGNAYVVQKKEESVSVTGELTLGSQTPQPQTNISTQSQDDTSSIEELPLDLPGIDKTLFPFLDSGISGMSNILPNSRSRSCNSTNKQGSPSNKTTCKWNIPFKDEKKPQQVNFKGRELLLQNSAIPNYPELDVDMSPTDSNPDNALVGETAFQLERRVLGYVFENERILIGYNLRNIELMIRCYHGEEQQRRYQSLLTKLRGYGWREDRHPQVVTQLVLKYGTFLNGKQASDIAKQEELNKPGAIKRRVLNVIPVSQLRDVLVVVDCLLMMVREDKQSLFAL